MRFRPPGRVSVRTKRHARVALVTGASQGIGRAIAAELVAEGARVAVTSRSRERIEATADEIGAQAFVFDFASGGRGELVSRVESALGPGRRARAQHGRPAARTPPSPSPRHGLHERLN